MSAPLPSFERAHVDQDEWREVVARWAVGSFLNELEELTKRTGDDTPEAVLSVLLATQRLLKELGLRDGRPPHAQRVWRCEP